MSDEPVRLDDVAEELYGLDPSEFVARRDERAREVRPADRGLADEIHRLRRPSAAAWAVNAFGRERPEVLDRLLELGVRLRAAQAALAGDELRDLLAERREALPAALAEIRRLARERGSPLSDQAAGDARQTLEAALADAGASEAVRAGRLAAALEPSGLLGPLGGLSPRGSSDGRAQGPERPPLEPHSGRPHDEPRRRREPERRRAAAGPGEPPSSEDGEDGLRQPAGERRVEAATAALAAARRDGRLAAEALRSATRAEEAARDELEQLERRVDAARGAVRAAVRRRRDAEQALATAEHRRTRAADRLGNAERAVGERHSGLGGSPPRPQEVSRSIGRR